MDVNYGEPYFTSAEMIEEQRQTQNLKNMKNKPELICHNPSQNIELKDSTGQYSNRLGWELSCHPSLVNAYPLIRFSTIEQMDNTSLQRQLNAEKEACMIRGWKFDESLKVEDLGVSAFDESNFAEEAALGAFLIAAKEGRLLPNPVLLVENPDRFSRAAIDRADSIFWGLVKLGVAVLFLSNGLLVRNGDENNLSVRMILLFEFDRAHKESARKSDLIKASVKLRLSQAEKGIPVNMGAWLPRWVKFIEEPTPHFEFNDTVDIVRKVVALYLEKKAYTPVAKALNQGGVRTIQWAKFWDTATVRHILTTRLLIGHAFVHGKEYPHYYPAAISMDQWNQLQALLSIPKKGGGGTAEERPINNLFPGRVTCACCGGPMVTKSTIIHGTKYTHYRCRSQLQGLQCKPVGLRLDAIELDYFGAFIAQSPAQALMAQDVSLQAKIGAIQSLIGNLSKKIESLSNMVGEVDIPELKSKLQSVCAERVQAEQDLKGLLKCSRTVCAGEQAWVEIMKAVTNSYDDRSLRTLNSASAELRLQLCTQEVRRKLVRFLPSLVSRIVVDGANQRYAVVGLDREQGPWRDLKPIITALNTMSREAGRIKLSAQLKQLSYEERMKRIARARATSAQSARAFWKSLNPEERKAYAERRMAYRKNMTAEQRKIESEKISARVREWWAKLTPEQRLARVNKALLGRKAAKERKIQENMRVRNASKSSAAK